MEMLLILILAAVLCILWTKHKKPSAPAEPEKPVKPERPEKPTEPAKPTEYTEKVYWYDNGVKKEGVAKHMPQGVQVFDENGEIVIDLTTKLVKTVGEFDAVYPKGTISAPGIIGREVWFSYKFIREANVFKHFETYEMDSLFPTLSFDNVNGTITWDYTKPKYVSPDIAYGFSGGSIADLIKPDVLKIYVKYGVY